MPMDSSLATEVRHVTTTAQLEALRDEWDALWRADPRATPFQSPHWLLPWWRHVGQGELRSLELRDDDGRLVGLAPLYVYTSASGQRQLFPVGMATTDYLEPLALAGWEREVAATVFTRAPDFEWDMLEWPQLRRDAALLARGHCEPGEPNPVLALPASMPNSTLQNLRNARRRAARAGAVSFELAQAQDIPEFLAALFRLHARRWSGRDEPGVFADAGVRRMHEEAAPLLHAAGMLRLHGLRLDGELVSVVYALAHGRRCYSYIGGFAPQHASFSPGSLLIAHAIEHAAAEGATAFDFLRGAEAYKYRWGAVDQPMFTLRWSRW